ncbi:imelysin family protein [Methylopila sp. M107]|uniref:imelysin family protein n=1 Tax=Methylopila sp. M107 TaxID=1101190 RepID=UPI0005907F6E|nr:imelysin family protein [Methylopila sp. M107]
MPCRLAMALAFLALPAAASAATPEPGPLAIKVIETVLLPRYDALASTTATQASDWRKACADGDAANDATALRDDFQKASDAWSSVEFFTTGPVSVSLRPDRLFFAPDRRNTVAKALSELVAKAKDGEVPAETVRSISVAAQGFPALERVLYEPGEGDAAARCRAGLAIADNLSHIAADIATEWRSVEGPLAKLKAGKGDPVHFADPAQAAARLMTDLAGGVQRINDLKLLPVLGADVDAARPKAAEGWRSGRSARAIRITTASLVETAKVFSGAAPADVAAASAKDFAAAQAAVGKLPDDLGQAAADPKRRKTLDGAVAALKLAQRDLAGNLAPALGIPLGFNALDGD